MLSVRRHLAIFVVSQPRPQSVADPISVTSPSHTDFREAQPH